LAQKRAREIQTALRSYEIGLEKLEAGLKSAGLPADVEMVAAERKAVPQMAKSLGVSLVTPTEQRPVVVATATSGPAPRADQVWESRVSGETVEFVWVPALQNWVGRFEITRGQFKKFRPGLAVDASTSRLPVAGIKYDDMYDYAEWLTRAERAGGGLPESLRIRLPTEAEWETLAGCGKQRAFPWGPDWPPTLGNYGVITGPKFLWFGKKTLYDDGNTESCPVEDSGENEWGLFGIGGNVWEACGKYTVARGFSAWRGGCYANTARSLMQIDARNLASGDEADPSHGFRLMLGK
jgi:formylglycine-generating enzyme required for sulfatase activity